MDRNYSLADFHGYEKSFLGSGGFLREAQAFSTLASGPWDCMRMFCECLKREIDTERDLAHTNMEFVRVGERHGLKILGSLAVFF